MPCHTPRANNHIITKSFEQQVRQVQRAGGIHALTCRPGNLSMPDAAMDVCQHHPDLAIQQWASPPSELEWRGLMLRSTWKSHPQHPKIFRIFSTCTSIAAGCPFAPPTHQHTSTQHTPISEKDGSFHSPGPLVCWCAGIPQVVACAIGPMLGKGPVHRA